MKVRPATRWRSRAWRKIAFVEAHFKCGSEPIVVAPIRAQRGKEAGEATNDTAQDRSDDYLSPLGESEPEKHRRLHPAHDIISTPKEAPAVLVLRTSTHRGRLSNSSPTVLLTAPLKARIASQGLAPGRSQRYLEVFCISVVVQSAFSRASSNPCSYLLSLLTMNDIGLYLSALDGLNEEASVAVLGGDSLGVSERLLPSNVKEIQRGNSRLCRIPARDGNDTAARPRRERELWDWLDSDKHRVPQSRSPKCKDKPTFSSVEMRLLTVDVYCEAAALGCIVG